MKYLSKRIRKEIHINGLQVVNERTKNHVVLTVAGPSGNTGIIVMARTPSDHRQERNAIANIRKTALKLA